MIINQSDLLLIPFGSDTFHARHFTLAGFSLRGVEISTSAPHALICRSNRCPVRLNNGPVQFILERRLEDLSGLDVQFDLLKSNLMRVCGEWNVPGRLFLNRYFDEVEAEIDAASNELTKRSKNFPGLFEPRHWIFSAMMPLPRAHLHLSQPTGFYTIENNDLARVDFAFWNGKRLVAVVIDTGSTLLKKQRSVRDALSRADIDLVILSKSDLVNGEPLLGRLGEKFQNFWQDEVLPSGPFKGSTTLQVVEKA